MAARQLPFLPSKSSIKDLLTAYSTGITEIPTPEKSEVMRYKCDSCGKTEVLSGVCGACGAVDEEASFLKKVAGYARRARL